MNVSVRKPGEPFGTRREIKNLNSFRYLVDAVFYEVNWQIDEIEDGRKIQQATVLYNPDTETRAMRSKETGRLPLLPRPRPAAAVIEPAWVEREGRTSGTSRGGTSFRGGDDYGPRQLLKRLMTQSQLRDGLRCSGHGLSARLPGTRAFAGGELDYQGSQKLLNK